MDPTKIRFLLTPLLSALVLWAKNQVRLFMKGVEVSLLPFIILLTVGFTLFKVLQI